MEPEEGPVGRSHLEAFKIPKWRSCLSLEQGIGDTQRFTEGLHPPLSVHLKSPPVGWNKQPCVLGPISP